MSNKDLAQLNFTNCQTLADINDPNGIFWLGYCYEYGIGIEKDKNKAFTYYQKLADMNDSNGIYQVGYCYYLGIGVEIDKNKAFTYYLKSAEAGNSKGIWKTAICYKYGIGVKVSYDKFTKWINKETIFVPSFAETYIRGRTSKYGKCAHCNEDNTNEVWCLSCDPDLTSSRWTIRNKDIDDCIKTFQLRTSAYEAAIEWIPFDKLSKVEKIGEGGFGSVYSALWLDGIRKVETIKDGDNDVYIRSRKPSSMVALKTLTSVKDFKESKDDVLKEFKSFMKCKFSYNKLAIYGITQNTEKNEYLMVFQYANLGSLSKFICKNFIKLKWKTKLQILKDITFDLDNIHDHARYIHADFHSGNILHDQSGDPGEDFLDKDNIRSYIADLGLSRSVDESVSGDIYGVMPYVAPEVLSGEQKFSQAADIYGFGVIMTEMSTGQRPFDGHEFNTKLASKICKGIRPDFLPTTPKCYIDLAMKCMNSDPQKRPKAIDIYGTISDWLDEINSPNDNEIKKQFLVEDKVVKSLPIITHSDEIYSSKVISTKLISKAIKEYVDPSQYDSDQLKIGLSEF